MEGYEQEQELSSSGLLPFGYLHCLERRLPGKFASCDQSRTTPSADDRYKFQNFNITKFLPQLDVSRFKIIRLVTFDTLIVQEMAPPNNIRFEHFGDNFAAINVFLHLDF